jgi:hypothetical protein
MANNLSSNITRQLARVFLEKFDASRVLTKTVNTQLLSGRFTPSSGSIVDFKRPHDYNSIRTSGGDISSSTKSDIIAGKASGTVQNYFTVATEWGNVEEALELDQLDAILAPMATRIVTDLELDLGRFMQTQCNLSYGSPGTAVTKWSDVAGASALLHSVGVPKDSPWHYVMNPFTQTALADAQAGLAGNDGLIAEAWTKAMIRKDFAGMMVMASNALKSRTSAVAADRAGTIVGTPTATYVAHKDTMIQSVAVTAFQANATLRAGDIFEVTGRNRLSLATREPVIDQTGAQVRWRAVLTADVTLGASGEGTLLLAGPAIRESNGQYNTVDSALANGDVITLLGTTGAIYQPNLFYHKQAFGLGSVKLPKLYSTDTIATTEDGMSIRVSRYADGDSNTQKVRFDLLPAFACFNPFFAGQGYGVP